MKESNLLGFKISLGSYDEFVDKIVDLGRNHQSSYVCMANVHMFIEAKQNKSFAEVIANADLVSPDGNPLTKSLKYINKIDQERIAGMDILPDLIERAASEKLKIFFYGGSNSMLEHTKAYMAERYPSLPKASYYSPPFRALSDIETAEIIEMINKSGAHVVFVVLGCPKQENWMANMKGKINAVMIGIGGALPVMVKLQKRAPYWMQQSSLEWLFRLIQEPRRLFKRYFYTNSAYMFLIAREKLKLSFKRKSMA